MTAGHGNQDKIDEKPPGAWTAEETVLFMLDRVRSGDFYILVPDNETRREIDQLRMLWATGDLVEGRPALSRWDQTYKSMFDEYVRPADAIDQWFENFHHYEVTLVSIFDHLSRHQINIANAAIFSRRKRWLLPLSTSILRRNSVPSSNVGLSFSFHSDDLTFPQGSRFSPKPSAQPLFTVFYNILLKCRSASSSPSCNKWPGPTP
jgi:hypothetical protein